jgi:hypothetical protein
MKTETKTAPDISALNQPTIRPFSATFYRPNLKLSANRKSKIRNQKSAKRSLFQSISNLFKANSVQPFPHMRSHPTESD